MYNELMKIYNKERLDTFSLAISYIIDTGFTTVSNITDKQIQNVKSNTDMISPDYLRYIVSVAKDITEVCQSSSELIMFCIAVNLYDTSFYTEGILGNKRKDDILRRAISYIADGNPKKTMMDILDIEYEDEYKLLFNI